MLYSFHLVLPVYSHPLQPALSGLGDWTCATEQTQLPCFHLGVAKVEDQHQVKGKEEREIRVFTFSAAH